MKKQNRLYWRINISKYYRYGHNTNTSLEQNSFMVQSEIFHTWSIFYHGPTSFNNFMWFSLHMRKMQLKIFNFINRRYL